LLFSLFSGMLIRGSCVSVGWIVSDYNKCWTDLKEWFFKFHKFLRHNFCQFTTKPRQKQLISDTLIFKIIIVKKLFGIKLFPIFGHGVNLNFKFFEILTIPDNVAVVHCWKSHGKVARKILKLFLPTKIISLDNNSFSINSVSIEPCMYPQSDLTEEHMFFNSRFIFSE
jgi:hypothetical protein